MVLASHLSWKNIVEMLLVYSLLLFSLFLPWTGTAMLLQISMSKNDIFHYTLYIYIFHYIPLCIPLYIFVILNCVKSVRIQSFSGPHFPAFRLNREIYFVNFRCQSESRKIWTRKTTITDSFYSVFKLDLHLFGQDHSKTSNNEIFIQTFLRSNKLHKQMT